MDANKQCMCKGAYIDGMFRKTFMDHLLLDLLPPTVPATGGPSLDSEEKETLDVCVVLALQDQFSLMVDFPTVLGCHGDLEFRSRQKAASFWCSDAQPSRTKPKSSRHLGRSVYKRSATADATETQNRGDLQRQADVCKSVLRAAARI